MVEEEGKSHKSAAQKRSAAWADRRFWLIIALMVLLTGAAVLKRGNIRAYIWAYRLTRAESPGERLTYFQCLASLKNEAVPAVGRLLEDADPGIRSLAVGVLHHAPGDDATAYLLKACCDSDLDVVRLAARGLAFRGDGQVVAELAALSGGGDERRAMIATVALADVRSDRAVETLIDLATRGRHPGVRVEAIERLAMLEDVRAIGPLIDLLTDTTVFDGVTEGDMIALRAFAFAGPRPSYDNDNDPVLDVASHHVLGSRAEIALIKITGHGVTLDASLGRAALQEAWRAWSQGERSESVDELQD